MAKSQGRKTAHKNTQRAPKVPLTHTLNVSVTDDEIRNYTTLGLYYIECFDVDGSQGHSFTLMDSAACPESILEQLSDHSMGDLIAQGHGPSHITMLHMPDGLPDGRLHWQLNKDRSLRLAIMIMYVRPLESLSRLDHADMISAFDEAFAGFNSMFANQN